MTSDERDELISYLQRKQCSPCRGSAHPAHPACVEAAYFIELVLRELTTD